MDRVHHGDLHSRNALSAALVHRRDCFHTFLLQPHAKFEDPNSHGIELPAHVNRVSNVIAVPMSAEHNVGFLDVLVIVRTHWITDDPRIDKNCLAFRRFDAERGVAQPRQLDSFQIHGHTPRGSRELAF